MDFATLVTQGFDSVKLETGSGVEHVVYHSKQVQLDEVRACDGSDSLDNPAGSHWTSDWVNVQHLRDDSDALDS